MAEERRPLAELLAKAGDGDFLRSVAEAVVRLLMENDVESMIGAGRHERSGDRTTYRNGYRDRTLDTRLGSLQPRIPKLRQGSYFPPFLEPSKTSEKALVAVIQEAWVGGVSTRRVDDLVQAMGLAGISKSTVGKLCKDIDERVNAFLDPLAPRSLTRLSASGRISGSMRPTSSSARAEDADLDHVRKGHSGGLDETANVGQGLLGLADNVGARQPARYRIDADLTRDEQHVVAQNGRRQWRRPHRTAPVTMPRQRIPPTA